MGHLLNSMNMGVKCVENFLQTFENKVSPQKWGFCQTTISGPTPFLSWIFSKTKFFFCFSVHIIGLKCRMILLVFYWRKELGLGHLLNTLNMVVKCVENFLQAFENKVSPQKWGFCQTTISSPTPFLRWIFSKIKFFAFPCM